MDEEPADEVLPRDMPCRHLVIEIVDGNARCHLCGEQISEEKGL